MKRIFEFVGGFALIAFSFYFTDRVSMMVANKSELMQEIKAVSSIYETDAVDAKIDIVSNTIVPGKFGRTVNSQESYLEMHDFGSFNENYLVFDYVKPKLSIEDNKDKFITGGNSAFRRVNFIVDDNSEIEEYLKKLEMPFNKIVKAYEKPDELVELINGGENKDKFNEIDSNLKEKARICVKGASNIDMCKKNSYYLVDPSLTLTSTNLIEIKNNINAGSIILLTSRAKLEDLKLLISEIEYKDFEIVNTSYIISEKYVK